MLENLTIDINTTSVARKSTEDTTSVAEHATEHATEHMAKHAAKHAALHTPIKDFPSVARKLLDISIIGAAPFNHLIQKF